MTETTQQNGAKINDAAAGPHERFVIQHEYGENEGGYRLCKKCGTAKHHRKFEGFRFWFAGVGYESEPECI